MNEANKGDKMSRRTEYQIATDELNEIESLMNTIEVANKKINDIKSKSRYII